MGLSLQLHDRSIIILNSQTPMLKLCQSECHSYQMESAVNQRVFDAHWHRLSPHDSQQDITTLFASGEMRYI